MSDRIERPDFCRSDKTCFSAPTMECRYCEHNIEFLNEIKKLATHLGYITLPEAKKLARACMAIYERILVDGISQKLPTCNPKELKGVSFMGEIMDVSEIQSIFTNERN